MTKYELPDEPEVGSWVKDADGDLWEKDGLWLCKTENEVSYTWSELLYQYGPLESHVPALEPKNGDIRFQIEVNELKGFIVYQNGKWQRYHWDAGLKAYEQSWTVDDVAAQANYKAL